MLISPPAHGLAIVLRQYLHRPSLLLASTAVATCIDCRCYIHRVPVNVPLLFIQKSLQFPQTSLQIFKTSLSPSARSLFSRPQCLDI